MNKSITSAIFAIGEEVLEGDIVDTNSGHIARTLLNAGVENLSISALPDNKELIVEALKSAFCKYDIIITTGGLGPTFDDLTSESVALACGVQTVLFPEVEAHLRDRLSRFPNVIINEAQLRQAMLPKGAHLLKNAFGTAYGFAVTVNNGGHKTVVASMPGVPHEMKPMLANELVPYLKTLYQLKEPFKADLKFINLPEPALDEAIMSIGIPDGTKCIINVHVGSVVARVRDKDYERGKAFADKLKNRLNANFFGEESHSPLISLIELLKKHNLTLSVAESCTGGGLGAAFAAIPGVSSVFMGGVISYDNNVKKSVLGVPAEILATHGAVSKECAIAMVNGVAKHIYSENQIETDCAIAITGIAGPDGGTAEKPVGTVFIAVKVRNHIECEKYQFNDPRAIVQEKAIKRAILDILTLLESDIECTK